MNEQLSSNDLAPVYNIKAVARMVGLLPVTIRAWERRYGLPAPLRGSQGYRLYSEYDVRTLLWLKGQVEAELTIRQAVEYLRELRKQGRDPAQQGIITGEAPITPERLSHQLIGAFFRFDEAAAQEVLRKAFALFSIEQVLAEVIEPALVSIGVGWARGEVSIAVEHFGSQVILQRLMSLLANSGPPSRLGTILAACLPGEEHEIGLLMLAVLLRWRGCDVRYLGPNLSLGDIAEVFAPLHPRLLLFSATRPESAAGLSQLPEILEKFPAPPPLVVLGGQAFEVAELPQGLPAHLLQGGLKQLVQQIEQLMESRPAH